ncbi:MAG: hypothetical protein ACRD8U_03210 [Pyrinomonadaceae bacterium]
MASTTRIFIMACFLGMTLFVSSLGQTAQVSLPNPVLVFVGAEYFQMGGKSFLRYRYAVDNFGAYPKELFAAAPTLPPCGTNTKSSRTWVDIYEQRGKRLNGFCALGTPDNLGTLWFAMEEGEIPPSWIYIEMTDRQTNTKYKSNLAESTL